MWGAMILFCVIPAIILIEAAEKRRWPIWAKWASLIFFVASISLWPVGVMLS